MQRQHSPKTPALRHAWMALLISASLGACENRDSGQQPTELEQPSTPPMPGEPQTPESPPGLDDDTTAMADHCPMGVEGVSVMAVDTTDGIALEFLNGSGDPADLRGRVQHMASMYEAHAGHGPMMWHHMGHMRDEGYQPGMGSEMPAATARIEDTPTGVRLVLTPRDPTQLEALRAQVRDHQKHMSGGECWMAEH